ncbi:hypothetical protein BU26DRAFT_295923 [Trematosphaeria pertusa]|uniref:Uncharacterized protein n=1 Tax=Trematosphaeria pertusa TaxID=390896 RepID=A0A6A6IHT1_9PLEO|nr:uncharacterized protein BU26DRAFT_295923 [Trematosphaeria pertusa]KAF2250124.1 hypothetical protein BU26DRAFT_295923 [Trematosphaeria pertusa]
MHILEIIASFVVISTTSLAVYASPSSPPEDRAVQLAARDGETMRFFKLPDFAGPSEEVKVTRDSCIRLAQDKSIAWHSKSVHLPDPPEKWSCVLFNEEDCLPPAKSKSYTITSTSPLGNLAVAGFDTFGSMKCHHA